LQASLFRAEASHLPEGITAVYRRALTAHEAVQKQIERLRDVVATSFGEEGESSRGDKFAKYTERAKFLVRDVEAFDKEQLVAAGGPTDPNVVDRQLELEQRRIELDTERLALVRGLGLRQGVATVFVGLYNKLPTEALDFDVAATRRRLGIDGADVGVKAGTDVLLPGTGILRDLSDALDRYFDGQMVEDDKAQAHYQWLDTYRQAAESWVAQALGFLNLVPGVPE
jgi:hypothetical protein